MLLKNVTHEVEKHCIIKLDWVMGFVCPNYFLATRNTIPDGKFKNKEEKIEDKRMSELLTTVKQMKEQITQMNEIVVMIYEKEVNIKMEQHTLRLQRK